MVNKHLVLLIDAVAVAISVALFQLAFVYLSFDGVLSIERILVDSIIGFVFILVSLCLFTTMGRSGDFRRVIGGAVTGSFLWVLYIVITTVASDWAYISMHPEQLYRRHFIPALPAFAVLVPLITVLIVSVAAFIRLIAGAHRNTPNFK